MASDASTSFFGWVSNDKSAAKGLDFTEFTPKPFTDDDIDIKITHCGTDYPIVVGHEIVGNVVRKGKNVMDLEIGDRVGVGAQCYSCLNCDQCRKGNESYCADHVWTYGMRFADGAKSNGGYAEYGRYPASFAFKLSESIPSEIVAPMLCGGLTIYAISRTRSKEADVRTMGATDFIATAEPGWVENNLQSIDLIVCTANDTSIPMSDYLRLLKFGVTLVQVGAPEGGLPEFDLSPFLFNNVHLTGTIIGGRQEMKDMLQMVATKKINSWIETKPMSNVNEVVQLMGDGKAHYRYVLVN
ncbi:chaperonin 10-like protein [Lipomyces doorenjongii]|uniref:chaperonin 10-like protein n=1 Tax=Lipomyces doorenjongii TaxID=383834 RepID=UPI0034CDA429